MSGSIVLYNVHTVLSTHNVLVQLFVCFLNLKIPMHFHSDFFLGDAFDPSKKRIKLIGTPSIPNSNCPSYPFWFEPVVTVFKTLSWLRFGLVLAGYSGHKERA
jgi:hypothetical protein